jgi:hypothetical protein
VDIQRVQLKIESKEGAGTTVSVTLPLFSSGEIK